MRKTKSRTEKGFEMKISTELVSESYGTDECVWMGVLNLNGNNEELNIENYKRITFVRH
jgi:hypothetical protein